MKLRTFFILLITSSILFVCHDALAQSPGFVQQDVIKQAGITTDAQIYGLSVLNKQTTRAYIDGLGRTAQTIAVQASPLQRDIIQPVAYDNLGRQTTGYLPYAGQSTDVVGSYRTNAISTAQPAFYNQTGQYLIAKDGSPYTQQVFENSPLQRMLAAGTVGDNFQPVSGQKYKTVEYRANTSGDGNILMWVPGSTAGTYVTSAYYAISSLVVADGKDEDGTETLSFTDLAGHMILKRQLLSSGNLDTYYIYNNAGMMAYIIPPLATSKLASVSYSLTTAPVSNLVFHFVYDLRGRLIEKTVPAKGAMSIVYDPLNRPVLLQDANMHANNKWNYIKYDVKGRAISQGIYTDATRTTQATMQAYVNGLAGYSTAWYESRSATLFNGGYYTNNVFPTTSRTAMAYSYYDDYDMDFDGTAEFTYTSQGLPGEGTATTAQIKGMPTMTCKNVVGPGIPSGYWLTKAAFYDKRGNPIQTQSNNQIFYTSLSTITDYATTVPDFSGVPQVSKVSKKTSAGSPATVLTTLTYDHMYRVKTVSQQYNGSGTTLQVAEYSYNELGQVIRKGLGLNGANYLQGVDMRYSIRGQLLNINNSQLKNDTGKTNSDTNDLFGMQMLYDKTDSQLSNSPYYNGKLSAVKWMSKDASGTSGYERAYRYYYDGLNRDTAAIYSERNGTGTFSLTHGWDENRITYDLNGNIKTLFRNSAQQGASSGGHTPIDNLAYTYDTNNPNQLKTVTDGTGGSYNLAGFMVYAGGSSSGNYTYDSNGNLASDPYKGIAHISYNVLNRTDTIRFSSTQYITYTYDASGILLRKQAYKTGTTTQLTDYVDGFVYNNSGGTEALAYFPMPEGRVRVDGGGFHQEFIITDQQGNARISFDNSGTGNTAKVRQENSYYAFGMTMTNSTVGTLGDSNKNLYNGGSEWQNDYGDLPNYQQTFYRNYDAVLGRFAGVDPVPESVESMTGYQYSGNNPIMFNDPLGDLFRPVEEDQPHEKIPTSKFINDGIANALRDQSDWVGGMSGGGEGGDAGDYSAFWGDFAYGAIDGVHNVKFDQSQMSNIYHAYLKLSPNQEFRIGYHDDGSVTFDISSPMSSASGESGIRSYLIEGATANQGGPGGEGAPNSAWTMRDNGVNWKTLWNEFRTGTGPTYSGFGPNSPMTKDLKNSFIVQQAIARFMLNGGKEPLVNFQARFYGPVGPAMSETMTEQFLGSARVSIYPSQLGFVFVVTNTTDMNSFGYHFADSISRDSNSATPYGTIYQKFMWISK